MSERNWGRAKEIIDDMLEKFNHANNFPEMNSKDMKKNTGVLVHLARGFTEIGYVPKSRVIFKKNR